MYCDLPRNRIGGLEILMMENLPGRNPKAALLQSGQHVNITESSDEAQGRIACFNQNPFVMID